MIATSSGKAMAAANAVVAVYFAFSVVVQYNDPDPIRWMLIYGLAGVICVWAVCGPVRWPAPTVVGLAALVWASTLAPKVLGKVRFGEMFQSFEMHDVRVEQGREMGGLLIVAAWMAVVLLFRRRR